MQIFPTKTFEINFREAGKNSYYTAKCGNIVYTRKNLNSLECFLRNKGYKFELVWLNK
jgi:hypothetical protein